MTNYCHARDGSKPTVEQICWTAGFFDGEGCILTKLHRGKRDLRVIVVQNERAPLDLIRDWFGGGMEHEVNSRQDRYRLVTTGPQARRFLTAMLPYLVAKRARAELALSVTPDELHKIPNRVVKAA